MAERRFDDKEVGEILKVAAEMQSGISTSGSATGMSLTELQQVAQEVGIDPSHITRAASEVVTQTDSRKQNGLDSYFLQQSVKGQLTEEGWEELVTELRRHTRKKGKSEVRGETREWVGNSDVSSVTLSVTVRGGRTRLKLFGETAGATALAKALGVAFGILIPLIPVIISAKSQPHFVPGLVLFLSVYFLATWIAMVFGFIRTCRKKFGRELSGLMTRLVDLADAEFEAQSALSDSFSTPLSLTSFAMSSEPSKLTSEVEPQTFQGT